MRDFIGHFGSRGGKSDGRNQAIHPVRVDICAMIFQSQEKLVSFSFYCHDFKWKQELQTRFERILVQWNFELLANDVRENARANLRINVDAAKF